MSSFSFLNDSDGCLDCVRAQTPTSNTNPKTPSPVGSISPWPQTTPCPRLQSPTSRACPPPTSAPPVWRTGPPGCTAAASGSPPSPSTWSCQRGCGISTGISPIPSCLEARRPRACPSGPLIPRPPLSSVRALQGDVLPSGAAAQFVSYRLCSAPHRPPWCSVLASLRVPQTVGRRARKRPKPPCSCRIKSHIRLKRGERLKRCRLCLKTCINVSLLLGPHLKDPIGAKESPQRAVSVRSWRTKEVIDKIDILKRREPIF